MASTTTGALGPGWVPSPLSEGHSCDCWDFTNDRFPLQSVKAEHARTKEQTRNSSMLGETDSSRVVLLVPSETKPAERKRRKISCAQGVNCRYSVPPKKRKPQARCKVLYTHTRTHTHTWAHTHLHKQLKTRLQSVGNSSNKRNRSKLLLNWFDLFSFLANSGTRKYFNSQPGNEYTAESVPLGRNTETLLHLLPLSKLKWWRSFFFPFRFFCKSIRVITVSLKIYFKKCRGN